MSTVFDSIKLVNTRLKRKRQFFWGSLLGLLFTLVFFLKIKGVVGGILLLIAITGLLFVFQLVQNPQVLVFVATTYAVIIGPFFMAFPSVPIGMAMDGALFVGFISILYDNYKKGITGYFSIPGGTILLIWIFYHIFQLVNPTAPSRVAWFYVMRPAVGYPMLYFITWHFIKTTKDVERVIYFWLSMMGFTTIWGLIQHVNGYFPFEFSFLSAADALRLVYIQGRYRIFGTLTSPAQFGVVMGIVSVFAIILVLMTKGKKRFIFLILVVITFLAMIFSGTRSAIVVIPVSLAVFVVISRNVKLIGLGVFFGIILAILMVVPSNNYHIQRMQSAFKTKEDASFQVRAENRKRIFPFILSHPIGGGLGSTGVWGMRFSPWHHLAQFAPDSGYLRVSVELGTVGLLLYILVFARFFYLGYLSCNQHSERNKIWSIALFSALSSLILIEWAQDINGKVPFNIYFWILMATLIKLNDLPELEEKPE